MDLQRSCGWLCFIPEYNWKNHFVDTRIVQKCGQNNLINATGIRRNTQPGEYGLEHDFSRLQVVSKVQRLMKEIEINEILGFWETCISLSQ